MDSDLLKIGGNRAPLEAEAIALQEAIKREKSTAEYLKYQYEEQKSALEVKQRLSATTEHVHANQVESAHDSLRAHAALAVGRMDMIIRDSSHSIESYRLGVLYPIQRAPCEILKEIFEYAVDEEHAKWMDDKPRGSLPTPYPPSIAFHISATCRHWREIAIRTPKLWRYICAPWIEHMYNMDNKIIGRTRFLRSLKLAGESGLELILSGAELYGWGPILTGECTKQWSHITIVNPNNIPSRLPMSPRLSIYSSNYGPEKIDLPSHLASSLVVMSCSRIIPQFTSPAIKLTTLDFYLPYCNWPPGLDLGVLFNSLPSLSRLTLGCDDYYDCNFTGDRIDRVHGTLEILSITSHVLPYLAYELRFISIPSLSVMKILDLHYNFTERQILRFFEAANSIKDTVTDLSISSSKVVRKKQKISISTLIRSFSQLKRLELHKFAITPGLGALLGASTGPTLMQVIIKDYPEGNQKLREIIEAAGPKASSWTISY